MEANRAAIIGVGHYGDERIPDLKGADNDAIELRDCLTQFGGFEVRDEHFLVGKHATGDAIREALSDLLWRTDDADLTIVYFSGHGFDDEYGHGYLAPYDMIYDKPLVHGVRMDDLRSLAVGAVNKDVVLLLLDACRSGIAASADKGDGPTPGALQEILRIGDDDAGSGRGRIVLASSGADENSREKLACTHSTGPIVEPHAHGIFTYHLLEGLNGGAMVGENEMVTLQSLISYVDREMQPGGQTPTSFGSGMQHAAEIKLVRASHYAEIVAALEQAEEYLTQTEVPSTFYAIEQLIGNHQRAANHPRFQEITSAIDARLKRECLDVSKVLLDNMLKLRMRCRQTAEILEQLVPNATYDSLRQTAPSTRNLTLKFWELAYLPRGGADEREFDKFLQLAVAHESARSTTASQIPNPDRSVS
jgi:uncharacterized caspase-like protein